MFDQNLFFFSWENLDSPFLVINYLVTRRMVFGYAYPAYECFKTVEKNKPDIEQLRFWCQYWYIHMLLVSRTRDDIIAKFVLKTV